MSDLLTYADGEPFSGVIGRTSDESTPAWPTPPRAPEGAPNVVMFVLDDVGFGQLSSFGGLVETPVLDRFADSGLRYTNMHTTALCSPSRGAILTGRNHHSLGLATISETSTGYPGYNAILPFDKGMLSEMLLPHGYNTFMVGKWHLAPPEHETGAGPYDRCTLLHRQSPEGGVPPSTAAAASPAPEASPPADRTTPAATASRPSYQLAERSEAAAAAASAAPQLGPGQAGEHPLMPTLRWAYSGMGNVEKLEDYSATIAKRERIGGKLREYEYMFVKLRHRPFSVYMNFVGPPALKGQEVLYIEGQNDGNMWAHGVGLQNTVFGTVSLKPDGPIAMRNQRYPLTELGILNLTRRLVEVGEQDIKYGECEVKFYEGAKINNRVCTCIEVIHPVPRRNFLFHLARIFVDKEFNLPIRYESYDWPKEKGGPPEVMEEYTYLNLKLNNGFTDADFDIKNPNYKFR